MFLALWNYLNGYVIIYVKGFSVERFVNLAVNKGIFIWDVEPEKNRVLMKTHSKNIDILKECCIKTGCKFEVVGSFGLPEILKSCQARKVYITGVFAFAAVMYIMSLFIWTVKVEGVSRINSEDVIAACEKNGISPGKLKHGIDLYEVGEKLMLEFDDISWIAVNLKGTGITVKIVETIPKTEYVDRETPTDVVANLDGKIVSVAAATGTPVVKEGDEVLAGDVLISNIVPLKDGETKTGEKYVSASGEVYAERQYNIEGVSELKYNEKTLTGKTKTDYSICIKDKNINFITPSLDDAYEQMTDDISIFNIGDYIIPFSIEKKVYGEVYSVELTRTKEEANELADKQLSEKLTALLMETGGEMSAMQKEVVENEENVTVKGHVSVIMRIDTQKEAQIVNNKEVTE
ncbi:MAG: sporulation protein YqfD [Candidatus Metalachnospira sp.]|nr:sporulation protein YqfD [Candidatus Metalachnospira sp.]